MLLYRILSFVFLLVAGIALLWWFNLKQTNASFKTSLAPLFQTARETKEVAEKAVAKAVTSEGLSEKDCGDAIAFKYKTIVNRNDADYVYLSDLLKTITPVSGSSWQYRVYVLDQNFPNVFALPGGVILVTRDFLRTLRSEAEVAAVLAHQIGHIAKGHCWRVVKNNIAARQLKTGTIGTLAEISIDIMQRHVFSEKDEDEAEVYAFNMVSKTRYDPFAVSDAFLSMVMTVGNQEAAVVAGARNKKMMQAYFVTHPPLPARTQSLSVRAKEWWRNHPNSRRYIGRSNLYNRSFAGKTPYKQEWINRQSYTAIER